MNPQDSNDKLIISTFSMLVVLAFLLGYYMKGEQIYSGMFENATNIIAMPIETYTKSQHTKKGR